MQRLTVYLLLIFPTLSIGPVLHAETLSTFNSQTIQNIQTQEIKSSDSSIDSGDFLATLVRGYEQSDLFKQFISINIRVSFNNKLYPHHQSGLSPPISI